MQATADALSKRFAALEILRRRRARAGLFDFLSYVWWNKHPLLEGYHTTRIAQRLTQAVEDYFDGISTRLVIQVPYRHGKSDLVSRAFPAYFLGQLAARECAGNVIMSSYGDAIVQDFSRKAKALLQSDRYQALFPSVHLDTNPRDDGRNAVSTWTVNRGACEVYALGLLSALTGRGASLLVLDDYCKSREEAESITYRRKAWDAFSDVFLSRAEPVSITVVCATPWHSDDVAGRIRKRMDEDSSFPRYEFIRFPARSPEYPTGYLFPERHLESWYLQQYSTLGQYSAAGLMDCDPVLREGALFNTGSIVYHDSATEFPDGLYARFWDLASTQKERMSDSPDFTVGALGTVTEDKDGSRHLWVKDVVSCRKEAPERNRLIVRTCEQDGPGVPCVVESVAGYKDTYTMLRSLLLGKHTVKRAHVTRDKFTRVAEMEPLFERKGYVHFLRASWNHDVEKCLSEFPGGEHDDHSDAVSGLYAFCAKPRVKEAYCR